MLEPQIRQELCPKDKDEAHFQQLYNSIDTDTETVAWLFRCRICAQLRTYVDFP